MQKTQPSSRTANLLKFLFVVGLILLYWFLVIYPNQDKISEVDINGVFDRNATEIVDGLTNEKPRADPGKAPDVEKIEQILIRYTNDYRTGNGVAKLIEDQRLNEVARWHSECLSDYNILEHDSEECGTLEDRYVMFNITDAGGENLFLASDAEYYYLDTNEPVQYYSEDEVATIMMEGWKQSSGHSKNMLDPSYTNMGIGVYIAEDHRIVATQLFTVESDCGWVGEPCCTEGNHIYSCYVPWECGYVDIRCG